MNAATDFDPAYTLEALESFVDGLIDLLSTNETFYRAAFMAGERLNFSIINQKVVSLWRHEIKQD